MNKYDKIDRLLNVSSFPGIPEHYWVGTKMQQAAIDRFIATGKFVYDPTTDKEVNNQKYD